MGRKGWSVLAAGALLALGATKAGAQTPPTFTRDIAPTRF